MEYVCDLTDDYPGIGFGDDEYSGTVERRERVVRCRDCKHAAPCPLVNSEKLICELMDEMLVSRRDFCSWGEEREA